MYWSASQSTLHAGCNQFWMWQCVRSSVLMFWPYQWCSRHCVLDIGSQTNGVQDRCMSLCGYSWCCTVAPGAIHQFCRCVKSTHTSVYHCCPRRCSIFQAINYWQPSFSRCCYWDVECTAWQCRIGIIHQLILAPTEDFPVPVFVLLLAS